LLSWELVTPTLIRWTNLTQTPLPSIRTNIGNTRAGTTSNSFLSENSKTTNTNWPRKRCVKFQDSLPIISSKEVFSLNLPTKLKDKESLNSCLWESGTTLASRLTFTPSN
jgi:hypothetical protein